VDFEIISEHEDGFVIVTSEDVDLAELLSKANDFAQGTHGTAKIASIHKMFEDTAARKEKILSAHLQAEWPNIADSDTLMVDVGVSCLGKIQIPKEPVRNKKESDAEFRSRQDTWHQEKTNAYQAWDDIRIKREQEFENFVSGYNGEIHRISDNGIDSTLDLPDSFSVRVELTGQAFKDLVLNYPHIFEIVEPDDAQLFPKRDMRQALNHEQPTFTPPTEDAPTVCVIDSGIQEQHPWLADAIDTGNSHCYLPDRAQNDTADEVVDGGHGTRVAGAVLFPRDLPTDGNHSHECWIQNARVLDANCFIPKSLFPPILLKKIVDRFHKAERQTRIFNHSIAAGQPSRTKHMSAWAASIDLLCYEHDIAFVQAAGNLPDDSASSFRPGVKQHLQAGKEFPRYLDERCCRIPNPAQSLQAITVGSVAHADFDDGSWKSISKTDWPSAFTSAGPGIWDSIKPDVVEYGGDLAVSHGDSVAVATPDSAAVICPQLVRRTTGPGPAFSQDTVGTSFSAPKVAGVVAALQKLLPEEPAILYRALIAQSARWPKWALKENDVPPILSTRS
jgi:hypothetical protein